MANEQTDDDTAQVPQKQQQVAEPPAAADDERKPDEAEPNGTLFDLELAEIKSTELKPVNAAYVDLISIDLDKAKTREKARSDYAEAMKDNGELKKLYAVTDNKFVELAKDIETSPRNKALLDMWCKKHFNARNADDARYDPYDLILRQCALSARLEKQAGRYRFADVVYRKGEAERIGRNYAEWLAPVNAIKGRIEGYLADIGKINAALDADEKSDWPIYQFWFVVAPKHLQLRAKTVDQGDTPGFDLINAALTGDISCRAKHLLAGRDRDDGSIYAVGPAEYLAERLASLKLWRQAVEAYAHAMAAHKFRPDDPAKLQQRIKDLADGEAATVKAMLDI